LPAGLLSLSIAHRLATVLTTTAFMEFTEATPYLETAMPLH